MRKVKNIKNIKKKKQSNTKQSNSRQTIPPLAGQAKKLKRGDTIMKIIKYLKLISLPVLLLVLIITGFSVKKNFDDNKYESDIRQLEGTSEFFYKPEGDERVWHVINTYSRFSKESPEYNSSEYLFTSDSVTVKNHYVGTNKSEFIAINKTN